MATQYKVINGKGVIVRDRAQKQKASQKLIHTYNERLKQAVALFYEQMGDNEQANYALFDDFNLAWKKTANAVNRTQKHTVIDPCAFEKQIEKYKQIALQRAIKQQENGEEQHEYQPETSNQADQ